MNALVLESAGLKAACSFFRASSSSAAVAIGPSFDESSPDFFRAARRLFIFRTSKIAFQHHGDMMQQSHRLLICEQAHFISSQRQNFRFFFSKLMCTGTFSKTLFLLYSLITSKYQMGLIDIIKHLSTVLSSDINKSQQHQNIKSWECRESNPGLLDEKQACYLCSSPPKLNTLLAEDG